MTTSFKIDHRPLLLVVGDDRLLIVGRSLELDTSDPLYRPVADRIHERGLVLMSRNIVTKNGLRGQVEQTYWATPAARNLMLQKWDN